MHNTKYPQERETPGMQLYLNQIKDKGYYIIIGDFYQDIAREVICDAYLMGMTGHQVRTVGTAGVQFDNYFFFVLPYL